MVRLGGSGVLAAMAVLLAVGSSERLAHAQDDAEVEIVTETPEPVPSPSPQAPPVEPRPRVDAPKKKLGQLRVGAGIGLGFGSNLLTVGISPQVSYIFKRIVEPGLSLRYEYTNDRLVSPNAMWHTFGSSVFVRLYPIQSLFFLVEGELINTGFKQGDFSSGRMNFGNLFLGGGYVMGVGRGVFIVVSLKVNVFRNAFYPSNIPIFGVGAGFGF